MHPLDTPASPHAQAPTEAARTGFIIEPNSAIEITIDAYGDVTLRNGSAVISISAANADRLADFLRGAASDHKPKDRTAAERQRRYRQRKRNAVTGVTRTD